jgi:phosphoribosyl-AMP cyclohydrolase
MSFDEILDAVKYDDKGLVAAIIQDIENGEVLMVGYMNRDALQRTLEGPYATFWSRSRQKYWVKGESSGHTQEVKEVYVDCDVDAILIKAVQNVAACHAGYRSCFYRKVEDGRFKIIAEPLFNPDEKY